MFIELVVARYREDLSWLRNIPPQIRTTIYDKNPDAPQPDSLHLSSALRLPNIGREAHTYLHHIITRWETLSPLTVFCQGKPFDHAFDFHLTLRELVEQLASEPENRSVFRWLGHVIDTDDARGQRLFVPWSKNDDGHELDLHAFHRALFGCEGPEHYVFQLGAQFVISKALIHSRSLNFYRRALQISMEFPDAAHCFERSWDQVFGVQGIDLDWLNGRETVYLKPVRRLK